MSRLLVNLALVAALGALATANLSCNVNDYCLNCAKGDGGAGDGGNGDGDIDDGSVDDGNEGDGGCTNTGPEVCDGDDNDCDGNIDEGQLPTIGDLCDNQNGECSGGVKQCSPQGTVVCSKPPTPEICDLKDNDCNNLTDEGDPGGGAVCGTNTGECVAGVNRCVTGAIQCVGAVGPSPAGEVCNNRDDDCDGNFDENLVLGNCVAGVDGPAQGDTGECVLGTRQCVGGVTACVGARFPSFELCDATNLDQDCDGNTANGYSLNTDPANCGMCGRVCNLPHAFEGCGPPNAANGQCKVLACEPNWFNNNMNDADGCEFNCGHPFLGNEVCNGIDDDCDGLVDDADPDMVRPIGLCDADGACSTMTVLSCDAAMGWRCHYNNPNVITTDPDKTMIGTETRCDSDIAVGVQADNDCDGRIDEGQTLDVNCDNGLFGQCRSSGKTTCDPANRNGPARCGFTVTGVAPATEVCDGIDNNCNNQVDEGATTGNLGGQDWVQIPGITPAVQIMQYEASRPGATTTAGGTLQSHVCSKRDVQPWTNVTYPQAEAACSSIGARLCSEAEWQSMCVPETVYPAAGPATAGVTDFTFIEAETPFANTAIGGRTWTRVAPVTLGGVTAMQVPDLGSSQTNAANALTQSARMDYRLDLAASTPYRVWVRMRAPSVQTVLGVGTTPTNTLQPTSNAATQVNDLVINVTWTRATANNVTHTLNPGWTQILSQQLDDGTNDGRLSVAYRLATVAGAQTYHAYVSNLASSFSGLVVLKAGSFNLANLAQASTSSTSDNPPVAPNAGTVGTGSIALAIGAWHMTAATNSGAVPPAGFSELWEVTSSQVGDVSVAVAGISAGGTANPGAFGDNTANVNGTAAATITIGLTNIASDSIFVGLNAGTTAGAANATAMAVTASEQWQWVVSPVLTSGAAGTHTFSIFYREDGALIDSIAVSRQATNSPTFDNSWSYATNPRTAQPTTCNSDEYDTDGNAANGDQDAILPTRSMANCYANQAATNDAYDMSGNVKEWTQARATGQNPLRGGASNNEVSGQTCKLNFTLANDEFFFPNVGFRCCRLAP